MNRCDLRDVCLWLIAGMAWMLPAVVCATPAEPPLPATPPGTAGLLVEHYHMKLVPQEGVWFSVSYVSDDQVEGFALPARYGGRDHGLGNAIVCVATPREFSALHRLQTDEVWHFYGGTPLEMVLLYADGHGQTVTLGPNVMAGESPQFTVPHGTWMGAAPRSSAPGAYSFFGTQLAPAFDAVDFEMGYRDELVRQYPAFAKDIERLTRADFTVAPADRTTAKPSALRATAFFGPDVPVVSAAPGVTLRELVGRVAQEAKTASVSVAKFTLAPGRSSGRSFNHRAQEIFLVIDGSGLVHLGDEAYSVTRDSTVFIPAEVVHSIEADAKSSMSFYAISAPAFSPDDYVAVKP
jgi:predicted cupin superfamily sugar epimerase/mannose-6-phosphate isomerase-like protein (cupin superfamily)